MATIRSAAGVLDMDVCSSSTRSRYPRHRDVGSTPSASLRMAVMLAAAALLVAATPVAASSVVYDASRISDTFFECMTEMEEVKDGTYPHSELLLLATGKNIPMDAGDYRMCTSPDLRRIARFHLLQGQGATADDVSTVIPLKLGVCAPISCSSDDIERLVHNYLPKSFQLNNTRIHVVGGPVSWDTTSWVALGVVCLFASLCLVGWAFEHVPQPNAGKTSVVTPGMKPLLEEGQPAPEGGSPHSRPGLLRRIAAPFALGHNASRLFASPRKPQATDVLNGMRVMSMVWVILGHTFFMPGAINGYDNPLSIVSTSFGATRKVWMQFILGSEMAVDTFFFLSAFLFAFHLLRHMSAEGTRRPTIFYLYLHRYLRLTPVMAFVMMVYYKLSPHWGNGPFWDDYVHSVRRRCDKSWWTQLLFIQNFYPRSSDDVCMGWSWYLGNDMVFYVLSPFLVMGYHRSRCLGWTLLTLLGVATTAVTYMLAVEKKCGIYIFDPEEYATYTFWLYSKPWARIGPWLVGLGLAYIWHSYEKQVTEFFTKRKFAAFAFLLAGTILLYFIVLIPTESFAEGGGPGNGWEAGGLGNVMYIAFAHTFFGVAVAMISLVCFVHPNNPVARVLGSHMWMPMAKITYNAYLVHPVVIKVIAGNSLNLYHFSYVDVAYRTFGNVGFSYIFAAVAYLLVEKPFMNVEAKLLRGGK